MIGRKAGAPISITSNPVHRIFRVTKNRKKTEQRTNTKKKQIHSSDNAFRGNKKLHTTFSLPRSPGDVPWLCETTSLLKVSDCKFILGYFQ